MNTQKAPTSMAGTNPNHNTQDRSPFRKAQILAIRAITGTVNVTTTKTNPIIPAIFSLITLLSIGLITAAKTPRVGPPNTIVPNPSPIAHQAAFVLGFSAKWLMICVLMPE